MVAAPRVSRLGQNGDYVPVCRMTNQRMVACLKFVRRRLGQVEALIDLFQTELETNMLSEKLSAKVWVRFELMQWELLFARELERRGVKNV